MVDVLLHILAAVDKDPSCLHKVIMERLSFEASLTSRQFLDRRFYMRKYFKDLNELIN